MKVTAVVLKKNKPTKQQIYIRTYEKGSRKPVYKPSGIYIEWRFFDNTTGRAKSEYPLSSEVNLILLQKCSEIERQSLSGKSGTYDSGITLNRYWLQHIKTNEKEWSYSHVHNIEVIAKKFESFRPGALLIDVDYAYLKSYKSHCLSLKTPNKINTINKNYEQLRAIIREAIKDKLFDPSKNPFDNIEIVNNVSKKDRLNFDEITKLSDFEPENKLQLLAKLMYLLSFYTGGTRFSDLCRLKWSDINGNEITFTPNKTKRSIAEKIIEIAPAVRHILELVKIEFETEKYIFPALDKKDIRTPKDEKMYTDAANVLMNRYIKEIAKAANLPIGDKITMHTARHSFADYGVEKDVPDVIMMQLLGMKKLSTYLHYKSSFNKKRASQAIKTMFGE